MAELELIIPDWEAPLAVRACCTTRAGGASRGAYGALNLGDHVEDDPQAVVENRQALIAACEGLRDIQWLQQIHGQHVFTVDYDRFPPPADAAITSRSGTACAVLTADCLPVLFCDLDGKQVAAAHAGWRGLLGGVLVNTIRHFAAPPNQLMAWLGPCIRQPRFEVGGEVKEAFLANFYGPDVARIEGCFEPAAKAKYLCDLAGLASLQLQALGLSAITDSGLCTYDDPRFYSYRRENPCGRFASLIYRQP